jgi:hypothetical protein
MSTNNARLDRVEKALGATKMSPAHLDFIVGFLYRKCDSDTDLWSETRKSLIAEGIDIDEYVARRGLDKRPTPEEIQEKKDRGLKMKEYLKLRHEFFETELTTERKLELDNEMDRYKTLLGL